MRKIILTPILFIIAIGSSIAQDPVYTVPGDNGQTFFTYSMNDNFLYAAPQKYRVTSTVQNSNVDMLFDQNYNESAITVSAGQSTTITIDLTAKGGSPLSQAEGYIYLNFLEEYHPDSIYAQILTTTGDADWWFSDWSNASTTSPYLLWRLPIHWFVENATKITLKLFAHANVPLKITEIEYYLKYPNQFESGLVSKFNNNTLWRDVTWRDTGNAQQAYVKSNGSAFFGSKVGIGTSNTTDTSYKLFVNGNIKAKKLRISQSGWPDYVFDRSYKLPLLSEVEQFIKKNNHLPEVASAATIEKEGLDVGDNQAVLLRKIEELTLYLIEQQKQLKNQAKTVKQQQADILKLKQEVQKKQN